MSNLVNFYGGKKFRKGGFSELAEKIRERVLLSSSLSDDHKIELMQLGSFIDDANFWVSNRSACPSKFIPKNIISQYIKVRDVRNKHYRLLAVSNPVYLKEKARAEIKGVENECDFIFT